MPRPKNQFVCGKCKGEFESYLDKQFLCPACRKKINPDTHCFNCGRKWKITNPGTREEDRQCGKCGMRMSPNLLIDIFSIERKKMTDLPWLCPKCGFEWTYIMLKGDPLEYRKCEPCGLIMFNDTPPEYGE